MKKVLLVLLSLCALQAIVVAPASAQNAYDNPKTNVFLRYGVNPVSGPEVNSINAYGYYDGPQRFEPVQTSEFGYLSVDKHQRVHLHKPKGVSQTGSVITWTYVKHRKGTLKRDDFSMTTSWNGKKPLSHYKWFGNTKYRRDVVVVYLHSPKLPNQVPSQDPNQASNA